MTSTEIIHKASQYLATAARSFIAPKSDDSHTNLGWSSEDGSLRTHGLNDEGLRLELNLRAYALDVVHPESGLSASFPLTGARHFDVVHWIDHERQFCGIKEEYVFELPYDLPYEESLHDQFVFPSVSNDELDQMISLRSSAHEVLLNILSEHERATSPRIWPHHFDTGAMISWKGGGIDQVGLGLAMPDKIMDTPYFYLSAYTSQAAWKPKTLPTLKHGEWKEGDWNGAVLSSKASNEEATSFFEEALSTLPRD